jgi:hypothetical protein
VSDDTLTPSDGPPFTTEDSAEAPAIVHQAGADAEERGTFPCVFPIVFGRREPEGEPQR